MTEQLPRGTPAERAASSSRRLVLARRIVLGTFGVYPLLIVVLPLSVILGDPEPPGTLDVVGIAASVALAYLCMRIMRVRTISPAQVPRRDISLSIVALTVVVAAQHDNPTIFFAPGLWWSIVMTTSSRPARAGYTLVFAALPAVVTLIQVDAPWSAWLLGGLAYVGWSAFTLLGNGAFLLLWEILNEAFAAGDAQARLAVTEERLRFAPGHARPDRAQPVEHRGLQRAGRPPGRALPGPGGRGDAVGAADRA